MTERTVEDDILAILKDKTLRLAGKAERIAELFPSNEVEGVEIVGSRAPIETVEAYGLTIGVDANGHASTVECDYGLRVH